MIQNMRKKSNLFLKCLVCLAVLGFAFLSVGGEFVHDLVHNHDTVCDHSAGHAHAAPAGHVPADGDREDCPLYQFLVQAMIVFVVIAATIQIRIEFIPCNSCRPELNGTSFFLPALRAPPMV